MYTIDERNKKIRRVGKIYINFLVMKHKRGGGAETNNKTS